MKKLKYIWFLLFSGCLWLTSCDVVDYKDAVEKRPLVPVDTTADTIAEVIPPNNILIEDFTGHTCGNCPSAAREAKRIEKKYPGRVFIMGIHCSFFALPKNYPNGSFKEDFRIPAGIALDSKFGVSSAGLPKGIVNRGRFGTQRLAILGSTEWEAKVNQLLVAETYGVKIGLSPTFSAANRQVTVTSNLKFFKGYQGNLKMAMYVTEDSVVNWQKDYDANFPPENKPDFVHMHVLRADLISTGNADVLNSSPLAMNEIKTFTWSGTLEQKVKEKNCHVLMVIYNTETEEIVQVDEVELLQK